MPATLLMKTDEVPPVQSEQNEALVMSEFEHGLVWNGLSGTARFRRGEHLMAQ